MKKLLFSLFLLIPLTFSACMTNDPVSSTTTDDGLMIEVLQEGETDGVGAGAGDLVEVHYVGTLEDGTQFDSSRDRGQTFSFELGSGYVIKGWDIGVEGMKVGELRRLTIPSELGYGSTGVGSIPPNATLIFEVELISVQ